MRYSKKYHHAITCCFAGIYGVGVGNIGCFGEIDDFAWCIGWIVIQSRFIGKIGIYAFMQGIC